MGGGIFFNWEEWLSSYLRLLVFEYIQYFSEFSGLYPQTHKIRAVFIIFYHLLFPTCRFFSEVLKRTKQVEKSFLSHFPLNHLLKVHLNLTENPHMLTLGNTSIVKAKQIPFINKHLFLWISLYGH